MTEEDEPASEPSGHDVTRCLHRMQAGDAAAQDELLHLVHADLLYIARRQMVNERRATLQPTALVNEAWMKLARGGAAWKDRRHFLAVAARAMRQILVSHARARTARKRDGGRVELELLDGLTIEYDDGGTDLVELHEHVVELQRASPDLAEIVDLRFFAGLTNREIAELLEVTERTIERRWHLARGWLRQRMQPESA